MAPDAAIVVATETFAAEVDGESLIVHKDKTRVRADHPLVVNHPDRFALIDLSLSIERATKAPGEKRGSDQRGPAKAVPEPQAGPVEDLSKLKQPALKKLLDERGIEYPKGPVANARLIELLESAAKPGVDEAGGE